MSTISLPGIFKIGFLECSKLSPQLALKSIAGIPIAILTDVKNIAFSGQPYCETVCDNDNNGRIQKTTIKFNTTQNIPQNKPIAFVLQCVNGNNYLVGAMEPPFPTLKISSTTGTPAGNPAVFSVEVSHSAAKSLLQVAV